MNFDYSGYRLSFRLLVFIVLCSLGLQVKAQASNYYKASVAVRSQSTQERQYAAQRALKDVLIRMSGSRQVLENADIQAAIDNAQVYYEQFGYSLNDDEKELAQGKKQRISFAFSPSAVEHLLRSSGQPFWPVNRPNTLVWLVEDSSENGRQFVSGATAPEVLESFELAAVKRGLPLTFPLVDLEDRIALTEDKVWSLDEEAILLASKRYNTDAVMVGRFSLTSRGEYLATWQFFHRGETKVYDSRTESLQSLGELSLEPLADFFASRYSILPEVGETPILVVELSGVENFGGFRRALDYFEGLASISSVSLRAVRRDTLLLYLQSDSNLERFESTLSLDNKVTSKENELVVDAPAWQQVPRGTINNPLQYRWSG